jgi:hypothetical protein
MDGNYQLKSVQVTTTVAQQEKWNRDNSLKK